MRIFLGAAGGTMLNLILFGTFTYLNGTPVPSVKTPGALLAYPTGSWVTTLAITGIVYFLCLLVTCVLIPRRLPACRIPRAAYPWHIWRRHTE